MRVFAVERPELAPLEMPARFKHDIAYFMTPPGERGVPPLPAGQYWVRLEEARRWLADGVLLLVSPLDSEHQTEAEITDEQQMWLEWMVANDVERVRLET
ncbi:MAG: hypothetical protein WD063_18000 [Pirellulales bacterium]